MANERHPVVLAVDPGTGKCGVALVSEGEGVLDKRVVSVKELWLALRELLGEKRVNVAVIGDRTGAEAVWREVHNLCEARGIPLHKVSEHRSTQEGRLRYWQENGRRGWRRLFPPGWLTPPAAFDDFVAVVLAERWLELPPEERDGQGNEAREPTAP